MSETEILSPAGQALDRALLDRGQGSASPDCACDYVDTGIGTQKVSEDPDCPCCTLPGFASWALGHGVAEERSAARLYLREQEAVMSAQAMAEARLQQDGEACRQNEQPALTAGEPS